MGGGACFQSYVCFFFFEKLLLQRGSGEDALILHETAGELYDRTVTGFSKRCYCLIAVTVSHKGGQMWLNTTKQLLNKSVPELSGWEGWDGLLYCQFMQAHQCNDCTFNNTVNAKTRQTTLTRRLTSHSCLTFAFPSTTQPPSGKKKKTSSCWGLFIASGLIYPRGFVLLTVPKENLTSWPNIKAAQAQVRRDRLGFLSLSVSMETVMKRE